MKTIGSGKGETLIRIHKTPRRQNFVPQDCEDCPCDPRIICDERETEQRFKTNTRVIKDTWRFKGDNETTSKLNEFWTGKSTFKVLANAEVIDGDKSYKVNQGVITLCTHCSELNTIPITDVFVPYQYHMEVGKHEVDHPKVSVILWRDRKNRTLEFQLSKSPCDLMTSKFAKFSLAINLIEVPREVPCFVLLYSEERNSLPSSLPSSLRGFPMFFQGKCVADFFLLKKKTFLFFIKKSLQRTFLGKT